MTFAVTDLLYVSGSDSTNAEVKPPELNGEDGSAFEVYEVNVASADTDTLDVKMGAKILDQIPLGAGLNGHRNYSPLKGGSGESVSFLKQAGTNLNYSIGYLRKAGKSDAIDSFVPDKNSDDMVLWLNEEGLKSFSDGDKVDRWQDNTKFGHDATQTDTNKQPIYTANVANGYAGVKLDGSNDFLEILHSLAPRLDIAENMTILVACKQDGVPAGNFQRIISKWDDANNLGWAIRRFNDGGKEKGQVYLEAGAGGSGIDTLDAVFNGDVAVLCLTTTNNKGFLHTNEVTTTGGQYTQTNGNTLSNARNFTIGAEHGGIGPWQGYFFEIIVCENDLPGHRIQKYTDYLLRKYDVKNNWRSKVQGWYDADSQLGAKDGEVLETLVDRSGNGYDITQGTAGNRATFRWGGQNGKPYLEFDGTDFYFLADASAPNLDFGDEITVLAVAESTDNTAGKYVVSKLSSGDQNGWGLRTTANKGAEFYLSDGTPITSQYKHMPLNKPAILSGRFGSFDGKLAIHRNNEEEVSVNGPAGSFANSNGVTIGADADGANQFIGNIYEVLIFSQRLTVWDQYFVAKYLSDKYNIGFRAAVVIAGDSNTIDMSTLLSTEMGDPDDIAFFEASLGGKTMKDSLADYAFLSSRKVLGNPRKMIMIGAAENDLFFDDTLENILGYYSEMVTFWESFGWDVLPITPLPTSTRPEDVTVLAKLMNLQHGNYGWNDVVDWNTVVPPYPSAEWADSRHINADGDALVTPVMAAKVNEYYPVA